jgi:RNA polymerase sigma-70 factor (sigma-E family)
MRPTGADGWEREFADYAAARALSLRRTAYLLTGDWHRADDVTQATLTKLYLAWRRIERRDGLDAYVRKMLVNAALDEKRRSWRREWATPDLPDHAAPADRADDRMQLRKALEGLPKTQRAVVVLRFWEDLSVADTAAVLGIREGTVKSAAARGLAALREVLQGSRNGEPAR